MNQFEYDFSVVMAVYNVEVYLREAVESLVRQTIGFSRIQLIMVDDGSTDGSGEICDKYASKYPENVMVIHKENGGVASARNAGLKYVRGRFLNFMDSDDKFSRKTFKGVYDFFEEHELETDVCTVPLYFFDAVSGEHWQNDKFKKGTRIIDLEKEYDATLMFVNASFFKSSNKQDICFDSHLVCGEDMKVILKILAAKKRLGVVTSGRYWYRRRQGENISLIQSSKKKKGWYDDYFTYLIDWCFDEYVTDQGYLPDYIQYELMTDLQWRFGENYEKDMRDALQGDDGQIDAYYKRLIGYLPHFKDKIILEMKMISPEHKNYILQLKYGYCAKLQVLQNDAVLRYGETVVSQVSDMKVVWEFLSVDRGERQCTLEGYYILYGLDNESVKILMQVNGEEFTCSFCERPYKNRKVFGKSITHAVGFRVTLPLCDKMMIRPILLLNGTRICSRQYKAGSFFPVTQVYDYSYSIIKDFYVTFGKHFLYICKSPSVCIRLIQESFLLKEIWEKNLLGGRKAVGGRLYYHLMKHFKRKNLWILSDRIMKADDNGEALFRYMRKNPPNNTRIIFAISKKSPDYKRMVKVGPCVDSMSFRHKLLHLICDVNISSHADAVTVNPYDGHCDALRDLLTHQHFVFLQHGIIKDDLSEWLNRSNKDISGFITSSGMERESVVNGKYDYPASRIWLTGLPRYDRLYHKEENVVTVMPTWRQYLMGRIDSKSGQWELGRGFRESDYYRFYDQLLNSSFLLSALEKRNCRLQFFPHPNLQEAMDWFRHDARVVFLPINTSYRKVYAESRLVVTDYSSAVFDFAYLRKPVVYCQFDRDAFFAGEHVYKKGYFDYERDGFGEVTYDLESLTNLILEYADSDFKLKNRYRERIDRFFAFHDKNNCRRVTEKILSLQLKNR